VLPHDPLLQSVLELVEKSRSTKENCILVVTPTSASIVNVEDYPSPVALIAHEKIGEFQETLLHIEERLIKDGHYCIVKLAEDKSYATIFIYVDESILN
jgi:transcription antitermination factor NusA-like protein